MKKNYFSTRNPFPHLGRWLGRLMMCLLFFTAHIISGQTMGTVQIGSGSGTTSSSSLTIPVTNYIYSYSQQIVTAEAYAVGGGVSGDITKIRFKATTLGTLTVWNNWTVYIGNSDKTAFSSTTDWVPLDQLTEVFTGTITATANEWFEITFEEPFNYTGGNLVVAVDENTSGWSSVPTFSTYTSTANSGIIYRNDSTNPNPATPPAATGRTGTLPQIQFEGTLASCFAPSGITANPTPYGVAINWNAIENAVGYNWIIVADNAGVDAVPVASGNGSAISATATGLSHTTAYDLYVKTDCGDEEGLSVWSAKVDFTTPVACIAPTLGISSNVNLSSATLGWTSTGTTFEINWGTGTFAGGEGANTETDVAETTFDLENLDPNTTYRWFVRQDCSASSDGASTWLGPFTFFTGYCIPASTSTATFLNNFSTAGAMANISNLASGYTAGGYQDNFDSAGITHFAGGTFTINAGITGGTAGLNVWVDWNNNFLFEDSERIYMSNGYINAVTNHTVTLPASVAIGEYRMRIRTDYSAPNPSACSNVNTRTETEDYKFTVVVRPQDAVSWANLQAFVVGGTAVTTMQPCQTVDVYTQAWDAVATEPAGANPDLKVWIGRHNENTDPATWPESAFTLATFNAQVGNNDEYKASYVALPSGDYYFVARYKLGFGPYKYGASNNGFWNEETNSAGLLTVGMPAINVTASQTGFCVTAEPTTINITSENPNYTYTINGTATTGTEIVTPAATTTYAVVGTDSVTGCTSTASIKITISENLTAATIAYTDAAMCVGSVQELSVDGGTNALSATSGTGALTSQSGSATLTGPNPFQNYYGGTKQQMIYKAEELTALGLVPNTIIKSIAVNMVNPSGGAALNAVVVKMKNSTKASFASETDWEADMTTVKNAATLNPVAGQNTLLLDAPFTWNGGNLVVEINYSNNNTGGSGASTAKYSTTNFASTLYLRVDGATSAAVNAFDGSTTIGTSRTFTVFNSRNDIFFNLDIPGTRIWSPATDLYTDANATVPYVANTPASVVYTKPNSTVSYVATVVNDYGCTVSTANQQFTLLPVVDLPTVPSVALEVCVTATVADVLSEVTGTGVQLYDALTGGVALAETASLVEGNYYASQIVGGCESARAQIVVVFSTPNFAAIPAFCAGETAPVLGTTSPNGISGTWSPAVINNMASGTYVFMPSTTCDLPQTLEVTVTPVRTPDFAAIPAFCAGETAPVLGTTSPNGISGTWSPAVINNMASGTYVFTPSTTCDLPQTLEVTVTPVRTPDFAAIPAFCAGETAPVLGTTSPNGISGTWSPAVINNMASGTYVFMPSTTCDLPQTLEVTVTPVRTPNFAAIPAFCAGETAPVLGTTSPNGISGTWSPAVINNMASGTYVFTPSTTCDLPQTLEVTVTPVRTPDFAAIPAFCAGETAPVLGTTSPNGISGTWSPAVINNMASGTYVFTPSTTCDLPQTLEVTVTPLIVPTFNNIGTLCSNGVIPTLPTTSLNNIVGVWSPSQINPSVNTTYVFTPNAGQCASTVQLNVTFESAVNLVITNPATVCNGTVDLTSAAIVSGSEQGLEYSYWADPFGNVSFPNPQAISSSGTFFIKAIRPSTGCSIISPVIVTINNTPDPTTNQATQDFNNGDTISSFDVNGTNLTWYDANGNSISDATLIVTGTTYYASQTINGCESVGRVAITGGEDLKNPSFDVSKFKLYPNPVINNVTIDYSSEIQSVEIYNLLGQRVFAKHYNETKVQIDLSHLATGGYIVNVQLESGMKTVKIIKK